jgi:hypothetical protein
LDKAVFENLGQPNTSGEAGAARCIVPFLAKLTDASAVTWWSRATFPDQVSPGIS